MGRCCRGRVASVPMSLHSQLQCWEVPSEPPHPAAGQAAPSTRSFCQTPGTASHPRRSLLPSGELHPLAWQPLALVSSAVLSNLPTSCAEDHRGSVFRCRILDGGFCSSASTCSGGAQSWEMEYSVTLESAHLPTSAQERSRKHSSAASWTAAAVDSARARVWLWFTHGGHFLTVGWDHLEQPVIT